MLGMAEVTTKTLKISEVREAEGDYGTFYWVNTNEGASYTISGAAPQVAEDLGKYLNRPVKVLVQKGKGKYLLSIYGDEEVRVYLKNKPQIDFHFNENWNKTDLFSKDFFIPCFDRHMFKYASEELNN